VSIPESRREIRDSAVGLLQWWSASGEEGRHWYVAENQAAYLVRVEHGVPTAIYDTDGHTIWERGKPVEPEQESLI
jgi:hypothetical protein